MLLLHLEELLDGCGSGDLLPDWFVRPQVRFWCLVCQELTVLAEVCLYGLDCESLMDPGVACLALVATPVWDPLVLVGLPWSLALVDEALLVLLCGMASPPDWFVVNVVLGIFV